ncbi:MAG: SUMF1/EgtB/PvdO family nonheme iron enzyme [Armatimonadota bacterium]
MRGLFVRMVMLTIGLCCLTVAAAASPIYQAAANGDVATVERLLTEHAKLLNAPDPLYGGTPLMWAAVAGRDAVIKVLLSRGANPHLADPKFGRTALHSAAIAGSTASVAVLLAGGSRLEAKDLEGNTPLHCAAGAGQQATAELLLAKGAKLKATNKAGYTPREWAARQGKKETAAFLADREANPIPNPPPPSPTTLPPGVKAGERIANPKDSVTLVWVPAGDFIMGSTSLQLADLLQRTPRLSFTAEMPQRTVYLDGYWIYQCEVTVAQYRRFCQETKYRMPNPPAQGWEELQPIVNVRWADAAAYAAWAGARLPTEAEWEKAARGTDARRYPWGNTWNPRLCNTDSERLLPVGRFPQGASPYGALDMAGNAWEWCADRFNAQYYEYGPLRNPTGAVAGFTRSLRGGGCGPAGYLQARCANRGQADPLAGWADQIGFRCVITAPRKVAPAPTTNPPPENPPPPEGGEG